MQLLNNITFIIMNNPDNIRNATTGSLGAMVAMSIIGNPNTMAGKF
jgi:hypothetical protein